MNVMLLDGHFAHALALASELKQDLDATLVCVGVDPDSPLLRSRYCDVPLIGPHPTARDYRPWLIEQVALCKPDVVQPIGYHSYAALMSVQRQVNSLAHTLLPPEDAFATSIDKSRTYMLSRALGIRVPQEITRDVTRAVASGDASHLEFPLILKARMEAGGVSTALVRSARELPSMYSALTDSHDSVLAQKYVRGDGGTFAYCGLYVDGRRVLSFMHQEYRSVPPHGGSGTRVATCHDSQLEDLADRLLLELNWSGVAQVEFRRDQDGELVLMEINPKFWASYALASRSGHRFASAAALLALRKDASAITSRPKRELMMTYPLRELTYVVKSRNWGELAPSMFAMLWPPAVFDFELADLAAHLPRIRAHRSRGKL